MGQISRGILNGHSVPGARPSLSSCPGSTGCHREQNRPVPPLLELRAPFSQQYGLASSLSLGSLQCNTGLIIPVGRCEQCVTLSSATLASQMQSPASVQWLLVRMAAGTTSCTSATALRMVKKHEATVSWRNYSFDLNSLFSLVVNQFPCLMEVLDIIVLKHISSL